VGRCISNRIYRKARRHRQRWRIFVFSGLIAGSRAWRD